MTPSCLMGTNGSPMSMISCSARWRSASSHLPSGQSTRISTSPTGRAARPAARRSSSSRSRSGIRAAVTGTVMATTTAYLGSKIVKRDPPAVRCNPCVTQLFEPATGAPLADVRLATEADVDSAVAAARSALAGDWSRTPPSERSRLLHALADALAARRTELAELEARNVGKAISSVKAEIAQSIENFRFYASAIASIGGRSNPVGGSLLFYSLKEPVGVCAQIVPWNYPLMLATWKLAPALAAGCTVVLKPDPLTPLSALRLGELATEVGIPAGVVNVVAADARVGAYLVRHPGVDKVAFTGSTATGGEIMRLCADPIKRVSLELGGKSPSIVFADADLADAVASSAWAIFYSAGQSCEA